MGGGTDVMLTEEMADVEEGEEVEAPMQRTLAT